MNIVKDMKVTRGLAPVAAGTSNQNGAVVDMLGFESILAILDVGTLTASQVTGIKWQAGNVSDGSDAVDLAGTKTLFLDADSNSVMVSELVFPLPGNFRYVRAVVLRGTANAVINGMQYIQGAAHKKPTTQDTTVTHSALNVQPAAGTP